MPTAKYLSKRMTKALAPLSGDSRTVLRSLLSRVRYEVMPTSTVVEEIKGRIVPGTVPITVTCSSTAGVNPTIGVTMELVAAGYDVTVHLAARQVRSERHLKEILDRLSERNVTRTLVLGGDGDATGDFSSAGELLKAMDSLPSTLTEIGIAGYPEGHPIVDDEALTDVLLAKAPMADFVATQICFDPGPVLSWLTEMRLRHMELPVEIGIPGIVPAEPLQRIVEEIGVGTSRRVLSSVGGLFDPTAFTVGLADSAALERLGVSGLHVSTFNYVSVTEDWRQALYDSSKAEASR